MFYYLYSNPNYYSCTLIGSRYYLLEGRRTIDVIVTKFFHLCFDNLDNVFSDWEKEKVPKKSRRSIAQVVKTVPQD